MQERNPKNEIKNFQVVQNIYIENFGSSGSVSNLTSLFLSTLPLLLTSVKFYQIFDIDFEIGFLPGTYISLIIYWFLNLCKDALFPIFS